MRKRISFIALLLVVLSMSFTINNKFSEKDVIGTYGDKEIQFIVLNPDFTFQYKDFSKSKVIEVQGKWKISEGSIQFNDYDSKKAIPANWEILNGGACLKAKKGLTIYSLCGNCK
ncbi:MAG: hypothetical protein HYR91_05645 [Flavobacteriia bacterium]|nr:hypothetical protein [Flavobacteriia bacterium]